MVYIWVGEATYLTTTVLVAADWRQRMLSRRFSPFAFTYNWTYYTHIWGQA